MTNSGESTESGRHDEETSRPDAALILRTLAERTAWSTGRRFLAELVTGLAEVYAVPCAVVAELVDQHRFARPIVCWRDGGLRALDAYDLAGMPVWPGSATGIGEVVAASGGDAADFPSRVLGGGPEPAVGQARGYLVAPAFDGRGAVVGHVMVIDEGLRRWTEGEIAAIQAIGARAGSEIEQLAHLRAIESSARTRSERLAGSRHDLRTPLNGILGYAQLLARDPALNPRHLPAVERILQCGERLIGLIDGLVDDSVVHSRRRPGAGYPAVTVAFR